VPFRRFRSLSSKPKISGAVILATMALAGCGGGSSPSAQVPSGSDPQASGTSAAQNNIPKPFFAEAEAICGRLNTELAKRVPQKKKLSRREVAAIAPIDAKLESAAVGELRRLTPTPAVSGTWLQIVLFRSALATQIEELGAAVAHGEARKIATLGKHKEAVHKSLSRIAGKAGFKECARVG
jgi:hypothetical protein